MICATAVVPVVRPLLSQLAGLSSGQIGAAGIGVVVGAGFTYLLLLILRSEAASASSYLHRIQNAFADHFQLLSVELRLREFFREKTVGPIRPLGEHQMFFTFTVTRFHDAIQFGRMAFTSKASAGVFDRTESIQDQLKRLLKTFDGAIPPESPEQYEILVDQILEETNAVVLTLRSPSLASTNSTMVK